MAKAVIGVCNLAKYVGRCGEECVKTFERLSQQLETTMESWHPNDEESICKKLQIATGGLEWIVEILEPDWDPTIDKRLGGL
jgi:hypothetical protein